MHLFNHLEPSLQFHCAGVRVFLETVQQFALHAIERVLPYLPGARGVHSRFCIGSLLLVTPSMPEWILRTVKGNCWALDSQVFRNIIFEEITS